MQHTWIFYALAGLVALGLGDFIKKAVLQRGGDKEVFLLTCFVFYFIFLGINFTLNGGVEYISHKLLLGALIVGTFDAFIPLGTMTTLKYLDVGFGLVTLRVITSIVLLIVGMFVLGDHISGWNLLGFVFGIIAIILLSGFHPSQKFTIPWKGGVVLGVTILAVIRSHSYLKYIVPDVQVDTFMFVKFGVSFLILILYTSLRQKFGNFTIKKIKSILFPALLTAIIFVTHFLFFLPNIYILDPLSLGYKILSYSLIVPIILSIIFYHEKLTLIRGIAFGLTILSLALFIV